MSTAPSLATQVDDPPERPIAWPQQASQLGTFNHSEIKFVLLVAAVVCLLTTLPYVIGWQLADQKTCLRVFWRTIPIRTIISRTFGRQHLGAGFFVIR